MISVHNRQTGTHTTKFFGIKILVRLLNYLKKEKIAIRTWAHLCRPAKKILNFELMPIAQLIHKYRCTLAATGPIEIT